MLDGEGTRNWHYLFIFEIMWLKKKGFKETLRNWWQRVLVRGIVSFVLVQKLNVLKGLLKGFFFFLGAALYTSCLLSGFSNAFFFYLAKKELMKG